MDTNIGSSQADEHEKLYDSDVCASADASGGINEGFIDVVNKSKLENFNVCEAVYGLKAESIVLRTSSISTKLQTQQMRVAMIMRDAT